MRKKDKKAKETLGAKKERYSKPILKKQKVIRRVAKTEEFCTGRNITCY